MGQADFGIQRKQRLGQGDLIVWQVQAELDCSDWGDNIRYICLSCLTPEKYWKAAQTWCVVQAAQGCAGGGRRQRQGGELRPTDGPWQWRTTMFGVRPCLIQKAYRKPVIMNQFKLRSLATICVGNQPSSCEQRRVCLVGCQAAEPHVALLQIVCWTLFSISAAVSIFSTNATVCYRPTFAE